MNRLILLLLCLASYFNVYAQYEYSNYGKIIELSKDTTSSFCYIQAETTTDYNQFVEQLSSLKEYDSIQIIPIRRNRALINQTIERIPSTIYTSNIYRSSIGETLIILPRIVVSLLDGISIDQIIKSSDGRLSIESNNDCTYILTCDLKNSDEVMRVVSHIVELDGIEYCVPEMYGNCYPSSNPYYSQQYYLKNTSSSNYSFQIDINVEPAWNITNGSSDLIVAVVDDGVERNHQDLGGRVLNGYTIANSTGYGEPQNAEFYNVWNWYDYRKAHGTACAGIIAASNNDIGIRGIASNVKILPINIRPDYVSNPYTNGYGTNVEIANAITWAYQNGADIISCSNQFSTNPYIIQAINNARLNGRNGKGCVIVVSSGNSGSTSGVEFPANVNGVLAVGAIHKNGTIWNYSSRGSSLSIVAPSGELGLAGDVVTTDLSGNNGYTSINYVEHFGGTSAACPQVAGVAALMLSVNSNLTESQVKTKIQQTARDLGSSGYDTTFGYGLVNAYGAVCAALTGDKIVGPQLVSTSGSYYIQNLPSGVTTTWKLSDNHYNTGYNLLIQNYPSTGHCVIARDPSHDLTDATLTAYIKYGSITIDSLKLKHIYAYSGFKGSYTSGNLSGNINYTYTFNIKANATTYIKSANFYGATVSYSSSGATPSVWSFSPTNGDLTFVTSNTSTPVVINVHDGCGNNYTLYAFASSQYSINVSNGEGGITVTLVEDGDASKDFTLDEPWTIEIINAVTGQVMATQSSTSRSETISTAGWPKGIYVVKVTIGKEELTEKVMIK